MGVILEYKTKVGILELVGSMGVSWKYGSKMAIYKKDRNMGVR